MASGSLWEAGNGLFNSFFFGGTEDVCKLVWESVSSIVVGAVVALLSLGLYTIGLRYSGFVAFGFLFASGMERGPISATGVAGVVRMVGGGLYAASLGCICICILRFRFVVR